MPKKTKPPATPVDYDLRDATDASNRLANEIKSLVNAIDELTEELKWTNRNLKDEVLEAIFDRQESKTKPKGKP